MKSPFTIGALDYVLYRSPSKAGRGVAFLKLARAERRRWEVLGEFAKYAFFGLTRKNAVFKRSVLKYVSSKNRSMTPSGQKIRVCVNQPDRLLPPEQRVPPLCIFQLFPHTYKPPTKLTSCSKAASCLSLPLNYHAISSCHILPFCLSATAIKSRSWRRLP